MDNHAMQQGIEPLLQAWEAFSTVVAALFGGVAQTTPYIGHPAYKAIGDELLGRTLTRREYQRVLELLDELGITNGWVQDLASQEHYRPDFENEHPFGM
jgi:hypothetical protein